MKFHPVAWLKRDWQLRLLGLAVAVVLWAWVHSEQRIQMSLTVPLELRNPPRTWRFATSPPNTVEVRLEADRALLPGLQPNAIRAVVDLSQAKARHLVLPLTPDSIVRPDGVIVLSVAPSQLVLDFEKSRRGGE